MHSHRFHLVPDRCAGPVLRLDGREAHHALHVLRLKRGDTVSVLDGAGREFVCAIQNATRDALELRVVQTRSLPAPPCAVTLLIGIPKGKIIESIIQKAVELGARRVVPLLTERVVTRLDAAEAADKREKWQQVAIEAIKQCGALWLPEIATPVSLSTLDVQLSTFDLSLVGALQTSRRHPRDCFAEFQNRHGRPPQTVGVWIGPEGDFTPGEMGAILAAGAQPVTFGPLTLRVETAATYALSFLNYELNR